MYEPNVIFEDKHILVVHKPSGLNADEDKLGHDCVEAWCKKYLGGQAFWLVHRLDRPVSGIMLIAKKKSIMKALQLNWELAKKLYIAVVNGQWKYTVEPLITHYHKKDAKYFRAIVSEKPFTGAKTCQIKVGLLSVVENQSILRIELLTGRYHQIRAQLSAMGHPIVGDTLYHSSIGENLPPNTMLLHAYALTLPAIPPTYSQPQQFFVFPRTPEWNHYLLPLKTLDIL